MIYFHNSFCISPQPVDLNELQLSTHNWLTVMEPSYANIPRGVLRRMGKAVRIGVGAALPLLENEQKLAGIIVGTSNGGMEDCIRFLNQVIEYKEGNLTPTNFVQSTTNAIAGQIGMMTTNTDYNATHVHRGLAFENALLDASFISAENREKSIIVGGVDEISTYNYNIDFLAGQYKKEALTNQELYSSFTEGSLAGEGAAMFLVNQKEEGATMKLEALRTIHSTDPEDVKAVLSEIADDFKIDAVMSGENGDIRLQHFYNNVETSFPQASVWRFKHLSGEYPTATSFALWVAMSILSTGKIPALVDVKRSKSALSDQHQTILFYNTYMGLQHSFMVVRGVKK